MVILFSYYHKQVVIVPTGYFVRIRTAARPISKHRPSLVAPNMFLVMFQGFNAIGLVNLSRICENRCMILKTWGFRVCFFLPHIGYAYSFHQNLTDETIWMMGSLWPQHRHDSNEPAMPGDNINPEVVFFQGRPWDLSATPPRTHAHTQTRMLSATLKSNKRENVHDKKEFN